MEGIFWRIRRYTKAIWLVAVLVAAGSWAPIRAAGAVEQQNSSRRAQKSQNCQQLDYNKMVVFSDLHYYSAKLGTTSSDFEEYLAEDRKLLVESDAILQETVALIKAGDAGIVLVPGDLTKDGELFNHLRVRGYLKELQDSGRKVYVIDGNHDINNPDALRYKGARTTSAKAITPEQFKVLYSEFGYRQAVAADPNSLSYVVELNPKLRLVVLDSALYDTNLADGKPKIAGALSPETLQWAVEQIQLARAKGKQVIGMMHHGLTEHFRGQKLFFGEYVIQDAETLAAALANAGMTAVFTGHFHAQDITAKQVDSGKVIYDIETGSLVTYPNPFRVIEVKDGQLSIQTGRIEKIAFDTGDLSFQDYSKKFLIMGLNELVPRFLTGLLVQQGVPEEQAVSQAQALVAREVAPDSLPGLTLGSLLVDGLVGHYQGDEQIAAQLLPVLQALSSSADPLIHLLGSALIGLGTDLPPGDNAAVIDLTP